MLMADGNTLIWGEPYARSGIIQKMSDQFRAVTASWPNRNHVGQVPDYQATDKWIANLTPPVEALRRSHRLFFDQLFGEPSRKSGRKTWGIKEVRLTTQHAAYLRWLFPEARFLFLVRDPIQAYSSYRQRGPWFFNWPGRPVGSAWTFGGLWNSMAGDFYDHHESLNGMLIRYEDLNQNGRRWANTSN